MIQAFPKIAALGTRWVENIFADDVEVTEKIDGSQFVFGWDSHGVLYCRSKGKELHLDAPEKMFAEAVSYVHEIEPLGTDYAIYCEWLQRPRHNTLAYERRPKNGLMLFGVADFGRDDFVSDHARLSEIAEDLDIEVVPLMHRGACDAAQVLEMVDFDSVLGGVKAEGVVVKNYAKPMNFGEQAYPIMSAKFVTEKFKEKHASNKDYEPRRDKWDAFKEAHRTEARWLKSVQKLRDEDALDFEPRDIGKLIKAVQDDIRDEEADEIRDWLYREYSPELFRKSTAGLPEWYKEQLAVGAFR